MRIDSSGNVGIGTSSPASATKLNIKQSAVTDINGLNGIRIDHATGTTYSAFGLNNDNTVITAGDAGGSANTNLLFKTASSGIESEKVRIDSSGNVGIGTSSPAYSLDVVKAGSNTIRVQNSASSADASFYATNTVGTGIFGINATGQYMYGLGNFPLLFYANAAERMRIDSSGNVGIGTDSPGTKLHVEGTAKFTDYLYGGGAGKLYINDDVAIVAGKKLYIDGGSNTYIYEASADNMAFITDNSERMRIHGSGSVSIGSSTNLGVLGVLQTSASSTTFALHNDSGTRKWFYLPNAYYGYQGAEEIHANGGVNRYFTNASGTAVGSIVVNSGSTAFNTTSDYRLKDNPQPLTGSGEFIDALQPKTWTWNHSDGGTGVGFIAHEAAEVGLGLCVSGEKDATRIDKVLNEETGEYTEQTVPSYQQLDYSNGELIANMVAELQSLRARIADLENQ